MSRFLVEGMTIGTIKLITLDTDERTGRKGWLTVCTHCGYEKFRDNVYLTREEYTPVCKNCRQQVDQDLLLTRVMIDGIGMTLTEASRRTGIPVSSMERRMRKRDKYPGGRPDYWVVYGRLPKDRDDPALVDWYAPKILSALADLDLSADDYQKVTDAVYAVLSVPLPECEEEYETPIPIQPANDAYDFFDS